MRSFNERIRMNGCCVSDEELIIAAREISASVLKMMSQITPPQYIGPGGVILALAATIFAKSDISVLVVEAGRGGEYDEARLIEAPVSVLTPIMLEHADKLGPTVQEIARTKTYITAPGSPIVTAPQSDDVSSRYSGRCKETALVRAVCSCRYSHRKLSICPDGVNCDIQSEK